MTRWDAHAHLLAAGGHTLVPAQHVGGLGLGGGERINARPAFKERQAKQEMEERHTCVPDVLLRGGLGDGEKSAGPGAQ